MYPPTFLLTEPVICGSVNFATRTADARLRPNGEVWYHTESVGWEKVSVDARQWFVPTDEDRWVDVFRYLDA